MCVFSDLRRFSKLSLKDPDRLVTSLDLRGLEDLGGLFVGTRRDPGYTWDQANLQMANGEYANGKCANDKP